MMYSKRNRIAQKTVFLLALLSLPRILHALDTDIYAQAVIQGEPKILVLLDTSSSMRCNSDPSSPEFNKTACGAMRVPGGELINTGTELVDSGIYNTTRYQSRMDIVKQILNGFLHPDGENAWGDNYHVGLATFSSPGAAIIQPIRPLDEKVTDEIGLSVVVDDGVSREMTARDLLISELNATTETGGTPTMGALFEAASYMAGQAVVTGVSRKFEPLERQNLRVFNDDAIASWKFIQGWRISNPASFNGGYVSPVRSIQVGGVTTSQSQCFQDMKLYEASYGRFTNACADETIQQAGNLLYNGPSANKVSCSEEEKHIILITDGYPQASSGGISVRDGLPLATWMKRFLTDDPSASGADARCPFNAWGNNDAAWQCMKAMSKKLKETHATTVHVISFLADNSTTNNLSINNQQLKSVAENSGGQFILATMPEDIAVAIQDISAAAAKTANFASPSVAIDGLKQFSHRQTVNYSLFRPGAERFWYGNLKRYKIGIVDGQSRLVDRHGAAAVDETTGLFNAGITGLWSTQPDGNNTLKGGAAALLDMPNEKNLFTDFSSGESACSAELPYNSRLHKIDVCSDELLKKYEREAQIGIDPGNLAAIDAALESALIRHKWVLGIDHKGLEWEHIQSIVNPDDRPPEPVDHGTEGDKVRPWMGAALHATPTLVNYEILSSNLVADETRRRSKDYIFLSTNDGHLYGIQANKGIELFRFIPEPMLNKVDQLTRREQGPLVHGLDSTWTVWREDKPDANGLSNGIINQGDGDKVALFGGMRRGGDYYYGLDVTSLNKPRLLFKIHGAADDKVPSHAELSRLGQTWSQPELINVKINGKSEVLLAIGGGYDTRYDPPASGPATLFDPTKLSNALGNAIYLLYTEGSKAGQVAAWTSANFFGNKGILNTDMTHSIPGRTATIDLNQDGFTDHIYFGDLGGQVFRMDIDNNNESANKLISRVQTLAKFGLTHESSNLAKNNRRFYEGPTVAYIEDTLIGKTYTAVAISSGWREHPFETEGDNRLYIIRDEDPIKLLRTGEIESSEFPITNADWGTKLVPFEALTSADIDPESIGRSSVLNQAVILTESLNQPGEKTFGIPLIADDTVFFSTLIPADPNDIDLSTCTRPTGKSRVYGYSIFNAQSAIPKYNETGNEIGTTDHVEYSTANAAGDVTVHIDASGSTTVAAGSATVTLLDPPSRLAEKVNWRHLKSGNHVDRSKYYQQSEADE